MIGTNREYAEGRGVYATRDEALDSLVGGRMLVSLRHKDGIGWCLVWLAPVQR